MGLEKACYESALEVLAKAYLSQPSKLLFVFWRNPYGFFLPSL
jgi:hypothetical protein